MRSRSTQNERENAAEDFLGVSSNALPKLSAYMEFFESRIEEVNQVQNPCSCLPDLAAKLRLNPCAKRKDISNFYFPSISTNQVLGKREWREWLFKSCLRLLLMVDCSDNQIGFAIKIDGYQPTKWKEDESMTTFLMRAFPEKQKKTSMDINDFEKAKHAVKAWKLKKRAHLRFLPTDNLTDHLLHDPQTNSVRVFHHTAWLKAQLQRSSSLDLDCEWSDSLKMGTLPPRLLYETLHSVQSILFRRWDGKSAQILRRLVESHDFDDDCLLYDGYFREIPADFEYRFWGTRLAKLNLAVNNPEPLGPIHSWLRRHANEKNGLIVAIVALILGAFFSLLSVIIGIVQTWISWKAWKNPAA